MKALGIALSVLASLIVGFVAGLHWQTGCHNPIGESFQLSAKDLLQVRISHASPGQWGSNSWYNLMIDNESDAVLTSFVIKASDGTEWTFNNQDTPPHYHSGVTIDGYQPNIFDGTPVFTVKSAVGFIKKCN